MEEDLIRQGAVGLANSVLFAALVETLSAKGLLLPADVYALHAAGAAKLENIDASSPAELSMLIRAREDVAFRLKGLSSPNR